MIKLELNRIPTLCITWAEANKTHGRVYLILWLTAVLFLSRRWSRWTSSCSVWTRAKTESCGCGRIRLERSGLWTWRSDLSAVWQLCICTLLPPQLTLKQRLQPEAWLKSAGIFTPPTDPLVTPNRLGDDQSALTGSSHPHISLLRTRAVFGEFSEWRWSDEWRCQVAAGCSFLFMHDDVSWDGTGKLEPWVWIVRRMIEKHQRWTLNTCKCWVAFCHAAA